MPILLDFLWFHSPTLSKAWAPHIDNRTDVMNLGIWLEFKMGFDIKGLGQYLNQGPLVDRHIVEWAKEGINLQNGMTLSLSASLYNFE